jgi:hypothetical protein
MSPIQSGRGTSTTEVVLKRKVEPPLPVLSDFDAAQAREVAARDVACESFSQDPGFPLAAECAGRSRQKTSAPQDVRQKAYVADSRPCPTEQVGDGLCLKARVGDRIRVERVGEYAMRMDPGILCSREPSGVADAFEIDTAMGTVVAVTAGRPGEFLLESVEKPLESLFGRSRVAEIVRQPDGRFKNVSSR